MSESWCYCPLVCLEAKISGVCFYDGLQVLRPFLTISLKREIGNVKDANSILVESAEEKMTLGHLEKNVAAVFAPLMDNEALKLKFYG